jgi:hypothetical protein
MAFEGDVIAYMDQGLAAEDRVSDSQDKYLVQNKFLKFILVALINARNGVVRESSSIRSS